jgi:GAF domain-containing protein
MLEPSVREGCSPVSVSLRAGDEAARLAAVHRYEILDAPPDGTFDDISEVAATVCGTPIATVTIVDADRVWFAAARGLQGVKQAGTEPGLCTSAFLADGPYVVNDALVDPRTLNHPLVRGELGLRFYAAAPIITEDQFRLGTVNVIDAMPRQLTENQTAVLSGLARLVAKHLEVRLAAIRAVREEQRMRADAEQRAAADAMLTNRLRQATAAHRRVPHPTECQLGGMGTPCRRPAEIRVADSWGDSAWGCATHAEEAIVHVRNAFVASEDLGGLAAYVERR